MWCEPDGGRVPAVRLMFGEPVVRRRVEQIGTDRYEEPIYGDVDSLLPESAAFDPGGSRESLMPDRHSVTTSPTLYFRGSWPDLVRTDRVVVRSVEYKVEGDPANWRSPWGTGRGGLVVELSRVGG